MICLSRSEDKAAIKYFYKSKGKCPDEHFYATISRVSFNVGRDQFAMEWLHKAINAGYKIPEGDEGLLEICHSKEFADYCAMRN